MIPLNWIDEATRRIAPHIQQTPITYDSNQQIYLKWENQQITGSFKVRGAFNKILSLLDWERSAGIVTASAGNHGQGVALAAQKTGVSAVVFASEHAVPAKVNSMQALGAEVRLVPGGYGEAEKAGLAYAQTSGACWVSPYNDGQVIAGQGTLAKEILDQLPESVQATWIVPVGGGGLISGIGAVLASLPDRPNLIGVQSDASPYMHGLFYTGSQSGIQEKTSLADGLSGPVEEGALTIPLVHQFVDHLILVTEEEIAAAIVYAWNIYSARIEGSAAVTLAAVITGKIAVRPAVLILTGGNIQPETHQKIVQGAYGNNPR